MVIVQIVVVTLGIAGIIGVAAAILRSGRYAPRPGEWQGDADADDARRRRWRARSAAGFTDRGGNG